MTPDSPKGPESEARPEEAVHAAAEVVITAVLGKGAYAEFAGFQREFWRRTMTKALAAADAASQSELERLTAEVAQLRADMRIRQGALNDVLGYDRSQGTPTDYYRAVEDVAELRREVSRLTAEVEHHKRQHELWARLHTGEHEFVESLLTQGEIGIWLVAESRELLRGMARRATGLRRSRDEQADRAHQRQRDLHNVLHPREPMPLDPGAWKSLCEEVAGLREQLAAQQRVWAPEDPTDESARLANALRFVGVVDPDDDCMSVFETRGEGIKHWVPVDAIALRMLEHGWGVSSSEVEAPRQHEVRMHPCADRLHAKCRTCGEFRCGEQAEAKDWKDQHEADTLRPQVEVPRGSAIINAPGLTEQQEDALLARIDELTEVMTDRIRSAMPVSRHVDGETDETFWTVQVRHAAMVAARVMAQLELQQHDEGRPSGSERLAPHSGEAEAVGQINEVRIWLARNGYAVNRDRSLVRDVRDAIRKAEADLGKALSAAGRVPEVVTEFADEDEDAASAARSEATPRVWTSGDPEPIEPGLTIRSYDDVTWFRRPNGQWTGSAGWAFGSWGLLLDAEGTLTEVLDESSPSLRKEGEDRA